MTKQPRQTRAQRVAEGVARAVGAGRAVQVETVDFNDPRRPKTCIEVDFPILPVNQVATIGSERQEARRFGRAQRDRVRA